MGTLVTDYFFYRWRYFLGYSAVIITFIGILLFAGLYVPGGLSAAEINATVKTAGMDINDPSSLAVVSAPYYLLQQASFSLLGVTNFSIKLPSLVLAVVTAVGAVLLLRRWFKPNVAVLSTLILIATGQFIFVAQSGVASITYIMWSVWLLLAATMITGDSKHKTVWKWLFFVIAALSLYTPLSIYLIVAIVSAAVLHPHVRYVLRRMSPVRLIGFAFASLIIAAPLAYGIYLNPQLGLQLLGAPTNWPPNFAANAMQLVQQYFNFVSPSSGALMTPVFGLGSIALILLGAWQLFKTRYTARSYTVVAWSVLLIPVVLVNPIYTSITFVPFLLLLASGIEYLFKSWYKLFPRNPYARLTGLIPLVILVGGLLFSGIDRYVYGYHYDPDTAKSFTRDLTLFNRQVRSGDTTTLMVTAAEKPFYDAVAKYDGKIRSADTINVVTTQPTGQEFAATRNAHTQVSDAIVDRIILTSHVGDADRFYVYKKP